MAPVDNGEFDTLLFTMLIEALDVGEYECTVFDDILDEGSDAETLDVEGKASANLDFTECLTGSKEIRKQDFVI